MLGYKILLAAALLTTPDVPLELTDPAELQQSLGPTLQQLGVIWEILDPRETDHLLNDPHDFVTDLHLLQRRCRELEGMPRLADAYRFPHRDLVNSMLAFNRQYQQDLNSRLTLDVVHAEEVRSALAEAEQLYRVWDTVRDVRCGYYYIAVRRRALQELRQQLGDGAYFSGQLPPPVPMWRLPWLE